MSKKNLNNDDKAKRNEAMEQLRAERLKRKAERKKIIDEEIKKKQELKTQRKNENLELKKQVKEIKQEIKEDRKNKKLEIKKLKSSSNDKATLKVEKEKIADSYNDKIVKKKNKIIDLKFNFGEKFNTLKWRLLKWTHGIKKEFNRVIWSSPVNTFKYLAIIVIIVLVLSCVFLGIDAIVKEII